MSGQNTNIQDVRRQLNELLRPESGFFTVAVVYGIAISMLTLAVPIAVQTLVNTIANIASVRAVIILSTFLFATLFLSGVISAIRMRVMEHYERRVYARLTSELSIRTILAPHSYFEGHKNTDITQRYFDIMTLQKNIPSLVVDGFALVLQLLVGFTLVSFYHPALFAFNTVIVITLYLIWKLWSGKAKRTAIALSDAKYKTAKWLHDIASAHEFFKSRSHLDYAGVTSEHHIAQYIDTHQHHFKYTFTQAIMFLVLYALASAMLLGLGGWLVVMGQLSIGQLVAAELIMSAVFFGLSRFSIYLKLYYELYGAADKLGKALNMPQETLDEANIQSDNAGSALECKAVTLTHLKNEYQLNLHIPEGSKWYVMTKNSWVQRQLIHLFKSYTRPKKGWIRLGNYELSDYDTFELRQRITVIDRSPIVNCTVKEYLRMSAPNASLSQISDTLQRVGLDKIIHHLPNGINSAMTPQGTPLLPVELMLLKLAVALLAQPDIIILNQHFDTIPQGQKHRILGELKSQPQTILYFTNQPDSHLFEGVIQLDDSVQQEDLMNKETNK